MTKGERQARALPNPHCDASPNGAHHRLMEWRDMPDGTREYWGVCKLCGNQKQEDASLGMGRNVLPDGTTFYRGRTEFRLQARRVVSE